jgi:hypothetical protein
MDKATKKLLKEAKEKQERLARYCAGLPKNSEPTAMYRKLNSEANSAISRLPGYLRSRAALDLLG